MRHGLIILGVLLALGLASYGTGFLHGPYSGAPEGGSITISWLSDTQLPARVEYGSAADYAEQGSFAYSIDAAPADEADEAVHVQIEELPLGGECAYRVVLIDGETEFASPVGFFCTEPAPGQPVEFAVLADTQQQLEGVNRLELVGDAIGADPTDYDFILHAGDVVESPVGPYWDDWFASFDDMLLRAPFIPVLGNHERNDRSYYETFELPPGEGLHGERWWALHWGDVVVVGLDTNVRKPADYFAQQDWLHKHLAGDEPHKFVIFHHPVFSSDEYYGSGYQYDIIFHPIFLEHDVDIVFNGHSHHYEHIVRDGITYMVVGGGGATPRTTTPDHIQGSDVSVESHYFYVRVMTSEGRIAVETVSVARESGGTAVETPGELLDSFVLTPAIQAAMVSTPEADIEPHEGAPGIRDFAPGWILIALGIVGAVGLALLVQALRR